MVFQKEFTEQRFCNVAKDSVRIRKVIVGFDDEEVGGFTRRMTGNEKDLKGHLLSKG